MRITDPNSVVAILPGMAALALTAAATAQVPDNFWINPQGGSWNDPNNWSLEQVPRGKDTAVFQLPGPLDVTTYSAEALVLAIEGSEVSLLAPGCDKGQNGLYVGDLLVTSLASTGNRGAFRLVDADCFASKANGLYVFPPSGGQSGLNTFATAGSTGFLVNNANVASNACISFQLDERAGTSTGLFVLGESNINGGMRIRPYQGGFPRAGTTVNLFDGTEASVFERTIFPRFGLMDAPPTRDLTVQIETDQEGWDERMVLKVEEAATILDTELLEQDGYLDAVVEVAVADLDGNGLPDIVVFLESGRWKTYLQLDSGAFVDGADVQGVDAFTVDGTTGDFDGNGTQDVAVIAQGTTSSSGVLRLYFNAGGGGQSDWSEGPSIDFEGEPVSLARTGAAGIGASEVTRGIAVTTSSGGSGRTEGYETSDASIEKTGTVEVGDDPGPSDPIEDENKKDPDPPIGVGSDATAFGNQPGGQFKVLQPIAASSGGGFEVLRTIPLPGHPLDFATGDLDDDGTPETLIITSNDALVLARPFFDSTATFAVNLPPDARSIAIADLDDTPGPEVAIGFLDGIVRIHSVSLTRTPGSLAGEAGIFLELQQVLQLEDQLGSTLALAGGPKSHVLAAGKVPSGYALDIRLVEEVPYNPCAVFDLNDDGQVSSADVGLLIASWGPCQGCPADFNGDGVVNGEDLSLLFTEWGPC